MNVLSPRDHVVVVGAGLAGWRVVESLRAEGFAGTLTLIGDEPHAPYDRPPLSKQVLAGKWTVDRATLATAERLAASGAVTRFGVAAVELDPDGARVELADGTVVAGTRVVLATGARARAFAFASSGPLDTLRSYDDAGRWAQRLDALEPASVVAVVGGGFIGAEAATAIKARGLTPVVLEAAPLPLQGVLGEEVAQWLGRLPEDHGVDLRTEQVVADVVPTAVGAALIFDDGRRIAARAVLAAVGSTLDLGWLDGSGLTLEDGVVVDRDLAAAPRVAAVGDVARFPLATATDEVSVRIEHWQVAVDHAARLARRWVHGVGPHEPVVPYFWSDQYGKKIQLLGHPGFADEAVLVSGDPAEAKWLALFVRAGYVSGVVALSQPRALMLAKPLLDRPTTLDAALASAPWAT
jgi:NADPH-dependent 2,4-dienoyl-CoA reductase/sulfur reductase-like enzyme